MATWPSGQAEVCKTSYGGSNPPVASYFFAAFVQGFRTLPFHGSNTGSNPVRGTNLCSKGQFYGTKLGRRVLPQALLRRNPVSGTWLNTKITSSKYLKATLPMKFVVCYLNIWSLQLSWLERQVVALEAVGSNPIRLPFYCFFCRVRLGVQDAALSRR